MSPASKTGQAQGKVRFMKYECIVAGGGASGIAAAISAARSGVETLLVECDGGVGGDLFSGMPILGTFTSRGEQCFHGILDDLKEECDRLDPDAWIGPVCDWRTVYGLCVDPEILRLAVYALLKRYKVKLLLNAMIVSAECQNGVLKSVTVKTRNRLSTIECACAVDATGGGYLTRLCGGEVLFGSEKSEFQPVSLVFRMGGVGYNAFLSHFREHPEDAILCENPVLPSDRKEAAEKLYAAGLPYVAVPSTSSLLGPYLQSGELHPCTAAFVTPTSRLRGEVCINVTRIAPLDCSDDFAVSNSLPVLSEQVANSVRLFRKVLPGFERSSVSSIMFKTGIRESGRIVGEYVMTQNDVVDAVRFPDAVARGSHHVDIHGEGTRQVRIPVRDGLFYEIPFRALLPRSLKNVIVAGRCISSDRAANGSLRVMGSCLATGQAAGSAAAHFARKKLMDMRDAGKFLSFS